MGFQVKTRWIVLGFVVVLAVVAGALIGGYHIGRSAGGVARTEDSVSLSLDKLPNGNDFGEQYDDDNSESHGSSGSKPSER